MYVYLRPHPINYHGQGQRDLHCTRQPRTHQPNYLYHMYNLRLLNTCLTHECHLCIDANCSMCWMPVANSWSQSLSSSSSNFYFRQFTVYMITNTTYQVNRHCKRSEVVRKDCVSSSWQPIELLHTCPNATTGRILVAAHSLSIT